MKQKYRQWLSEAEQDGGMYVKRFVEFYDYVIKEYTEEVQIEHTSAVLKKIQDAFGGSKDDGG